MLASQSPRRAEILRNAGIPFTVRVSDVDETPHEGERPGPYVRRLAEAKARAVGTSPGEIVLAADTTVVAAGELLAKPTDAEDARRMLRLLSGRRHEVLTGICLLRGGETICDQASTAVWFASLTVEEIEDYVNSGEPMDKAGGYAIQGLASKYVERIEGCYFNVMGLPVSMVWRHLKALSA
ncbi:MAG TPA: Maf family protein [Candidatus Acidoferrum sp.]|nr:Maf family protein [Candidatus Acidoferrum sp.]